MTETMGGRSRRVLLLIAAGLIVAGAALLALAWATAAYTDHQAYAAALDALRQSLGADPSPADHAEATGRFVALQEQYRTAKWAYADAGYAALAWGVLIIMALRARRRVAAVGWASRRALLVTLPMIAGLGLVLFGLIMSAWQPAQRQQLPDWHEGLNLAFFSAFAFIGLIAPFVIAFALSPIFFSRRVPAAPWTLRGSRSWAGAAVITGLYLPPILGALVLIASALQPGGWAASAGGAILMWSLLNGRAIWLGARSRPERNLPNGREGRLLPASRLGGPDG